MGDSTKQGAQNWHCPALRMDPEGLLALEKVTGFTWNFFLLFLSQKMFCVDFKRMKNSNCKYFGEEYMSLRSMRFRGCQVKTLGQSRVVWLIVLLSGKAQFCHLHWRWCLPPN